MCPTEQGTHSVGTHLTQSLMDACLRNVLRWARSCYHWGAILSSLAPPGSQTSGNADLLPDRGTHGKHRAWGPLKDLKCCSQFPQRIQCPILPSSAEPRKASGICWVGRLQLPQQNPGGTGRATPDFGTWTPPNSTMSPSSSSRSRTHRLRHAWTLSAPSVPVPTA